MIRQLAPWLMVGPCGAHLPARAAVIRGPRRVVAPPDSIAKRTTWARSPHPDPATASRSRGSDTDAVIDVEQRPAPAGAAIAPPGTPDPLLDLSR